MRCQFLRYMPIIQAMFLANFAEFKTVFLGKVLDRLIWVATYVIIMGYVMPSFGLNNTYAPFLLASLISSIGLLETYSSAAAIAADLAGDRTISYYLTLPIPSWVVFVCMISFYAFHFAALALFIFPFGNLILPRPISLSSISWLRFVVIFILVNFFHGAVVLWMAAMIKNMATLGKMWSRVLHPAWFFGCFQFSWQTLYNLWPKMAYFILLNPVVYSMEGMRVALLGQHDFLPFWFCCIALVVSIILLSLSAIRVFRKRLDFV